MGLSGEKVWLKITIRELNNRLVKYIGKSERIVRGEGGCRMGWRNKEIGQLL